MLTGMANRLVEIILKSTLIDMLMFLIIIYAYVSYNKSTIDRWTKRCILPFPKKDDLGIAKKYRGITLTSIAAKIYNALVRNRIEPKNT